MYYTICVYRTAVSDSMSDSAKSLAEAHDTTRRAELEGCTWV